MALQLTADQVFKQVLRKYSELLLKLVLVCKRSPVDYITVLTVLDIWVGTSFYHI